jgi:O-antigen/teichoic acid export membrane protein
MSFIKDVGFLQISNLFSIFIGAIGSIILARSLGPESYGIYGLIFAFTGIIGLLMNWGADYASLTLLAEAYAIKDRKEIINILTYYIKISLIIVLSIGILGIIFSSQITKLLYHNAEIGQLGRIVLFGIIINIIYNLLSIILQTSRRIKQLIVLEILNKFVFVFLPIVFVLFGLGVLGYVWGYLISAFLFLFVSFLALYFLSRNEEMMISFREIFSIFKKIDLKRYFRFGFSIAINKNIGILYSLLPTIVLGAFSSTTDVAYFKIAMGYIGFPLMVLEPISRLLGVQLPKSKIYGIGTLRKHFYKVSLLSGLGCFCLMIIFAVLAPLLIKLLYGVEYISSINLVYWLSIFGIVSGFEIGLGSVYRTLDKMRTSIIITISQLVLVILTVLLLMKFYSPLMSVTLSLIVCALIFLFVHFYAIRIILRSKEKNNQDEF